METFYILATGPSINGISAEQWAFLKRSKTIGVTWFGRHPFIPTHHYSHEYHGGVSEMLTDRYRDAERHPHLLIGNNVYKKFGWADNITMVRPGMVMKAFKGKIWSMEDDEPPESFDTVWATSFDQELFAYRGSLMCAINSATILGANKIVLCGVDLTDNKHFYKDEVHSPFWDRLQKEKGEWEKDKEQHSTTTDYIGSRGVVDGIRWVSQYVPIVCANEDSLLVTEGAIRYEVIQSD